MTKMASSELIFLFLSLMLSVSAQAPDFRTQDQSRGNPDDEPVANNLPNNQFPPVDNNGNEDKPSPEELELIKECNCGENRVSICGSDGITYYNPCVFRCKKSEGVSCRCRGECGTCLYTCEDDVNYASQCPAWARQGMCEADKQFMQRNCKHSCGICTLPVCYRLNVLASRDISSFCRQKY